MRGLAWFNTIANGLFLLVELRMVFFIPGYADIRDFALITVVILNTTGKINIPRIATSTGIGSRRPVS